MHLATKVISAPQQAGDAMNTTASGPEHDESRPASQAAILEPT